MDEFYYAPRETVYGLCEYLSTITDRDSYRLMLQTNGLELNDSFIRFMNIHVFRDYKRSLALLPMAKVIPWLLSNAISVVGLTFIQAFGMRFFVYELVQGRTFQELLWLFLAYAVVGVVLYLAKTWSRLKVYPIFTNVRTEQMAKIANHILTMDLKYYEDQSFLTQAFSALPVYLLMIRV